ncbi:MAG TPA: hypothetical protein VNK95_00650, partial [Caldilineaceae bacterium]|nr:hypothetical protein [Caldilineaceae bacterium]
MAIKSRHQPAFSVSVPSAPASRRRQRRLANGVAYGVMAVLGVMFMFPWFWTLSTSLKRPA